MARKKKKPSIDGKVKAIGWEPFSDQSVELVLKIRLDECRKWNAIEQLESKLEDLTDKFVGRDVVVYAQ